MKKISALAAIMILTGCSTTATNNEVQQPTENNSALTEVPEAIAPISLTVITNPSDARVRIMNIAPVYQDAIELKEGKYDVEVSKPGYLTYRKWVVVDKKTILTVELDQMEPSQSAQ